MCHVDQRVPAAYCEELWPQALKIGQRRSNRKPKCLSLWLGGICPDTGLSSWVCSSFSIGSPTTKSQALQQGRPGLSHRPIFPSRPLCFIFPQRCHTLKDCTCQKKKIALSQNWCILLLFLFIFLKKSKVIPASLEVESEWWQIWLDAFMKDEALGVPVESLDLSICGKIYLTQCLPI